MPGVTVIYSDEELDVVSSVWHGRRMRNRSEAIKLLMSAGAKALGYEWPERAEHGDKECE